MSPRCLSPSHVLLTGDKPHPPAPTDTGSMTEQTRLMLGKDKDGVAYKGFMDTVKRINAEGGMGRFFSGVGPRTMWISIGGCVFFGAYEGHHLSSRSTLTCLACPHAHTQAHTVVAPYVWPDRRHDVVSHAFFCTCLLSPGLVLTAATCAGAKKVIGGFMDKDE